MPVHVMPGLVPGIHEYGGACSKNVDGRDKPGHDDVETDGHTLSSSIGDSTRGGEGAPVVW